MKTKRPPISCDEAASRLGLDRVCKNPAATVRGMARRGVLRSYKFARRIMIDPDSIDAMLGGLAIENPDRAA